MKQMLSMSKNIKYLEQKCYNEFDKLHIHEQYCWGCGKLKPLSRAHIIRRSERSDLRFDVNNLAYLCFGSSDSCHDIWDNYSWHELDPLLEICRLKCFYKFVDYIRKVDKEKYKRLISYMKETLNKY